MDDTRRRITLGIVVILIVGAILAIERPWEPGIAFTPPPPDNLPAHLEDLKSAPDFRGTTGWLNTDGDEPMSIVDLRGKVVLVDFWTYSCINCIRTLPHLTALYDTYRDHGFVLVGVHSPEFAFEKDRANVQAAIDEHGIHYPVAQDNDFHVWDAYNNRFWPTHYLVGPWGKVRDVHIGEGGYAETEDLVRKLLHEAGYTGLPAPVEEENRPPPFGFDVTPELYAAHGRSAIGNPEGYQQGESVSHQLPEAPERDKIYLEGTWFHADEFVEAQTNGTVLLRFRAGGSNFVADGPDGYCAPVRLDGEPIRDALAADDVDTNRTTPCIPMRGATSYDFYEGNVAEHTVEFDVTPGFRLYTFAFYHYDAE